MSIYDQIRDALDDLNREASTAEGGRRSLRVPIDVASAATAYRSCTQLRDLYRACVAALDTAIALTEGAWIDQTASGVAEVATHVTEHSRIRRYPSPDPVDEQHRRALDDALRRAFVGEVPSDAHPADETVIAEPEITTVDEIVAACREAMPWFGWSTGDYGSAAWTDRITSQGRPLAVVTMWGGAFYRKGDRREAEARQCPDGTPIPEAIAKLADATRPEGWEMCSQCGRAMHEVRGGWMCRVCRQWDVERQRPPCPQALIDAAAVWDGNGETAFAVWDGSWRTSRLFRDALRENRLAEPTTDAQRLAIVRAVWPEAAQKNKWYAATLAGPWSWKLYRFGGAWFVAIDGYDKYDGPTFLGAVRALAEATGVEL